MEEPTDKTQFFTTKNNLIGLFVFLTTIILGYAKSYSRQHTSTLAAGAKIEANGQTIELEVARTLEQQENGLMHRKFLPEDKGMLFVFQPPMSNIKFWMKNTLIPIDMLFLRDGKIKSIIINVQPCTKDPCPTYGTKIEIDQVIELKGGLASKLDLKVDNSLKVKYF